MKILLIDDEAKIIQSLKKGLEESGMEVELAFDGEAGRTLAENNTYNVIVSDIIMPKVNGYELVKSLRAIGNETPILLLSALDAIDEKVVGLESGADDYLSKPFAFQELLARIKALDRRNVGKSANNVLKYADIELNMDTRQFYRAGQKIDLTPKEYALIEYFLRNPERVIPKVELAEKVWEIDFVTNTNVIEVYMNYLRNKMDKGYDKKLIQTQFGVGYMLMLSQD
ncbi:MAG: response regulator transcription factor [Saprospiraceae bacterium]|nr:response regulator transcription factor [Saprospiraceae bacterium]MBK7220516.1 response regulator transcription factor [Saprospiraceae bacterium]MBK7790858.1 response regulator transcription factor [Saprospiraceae bacterium]MBK8109456.1 response regulator transcription factor [Saprospiraceae bacterium]MBK8848989.1 response regulator transcription factor [Saprospiraceae bacterium]